MYFKSNRKHELLLPEIIHVDGVELVRKKESEEDNDHHRTLSGCRIIFPNSKDGDRSGYLLPVEYQTLLDKSIFAINGTYERAIEDMFLNGRHYWGFRLYEGFDTSVREHLLRPAKEFISCAFYLLGDCWYDVDNKWYSRDPLRSWLYRVMVYRFWAGQTGRGCQWWNAGFDKVEEALKNKDYKKRIGQETYSVVNKMVIDIKACQKQQEEISRKTWTCNPKLIDTFLEEKKMLDNMSAEEIKKYEEAEDVIG